MSINSSLSGIVNVTSDNIYSNFYNNVSNTEITYLANVRSDIQGQIDAMYGAVAGATVLNISDTSGLIVNQVISGYGIATQTYIISVNGNFITISNPITALIPDGEVLNIYKPFLILYPKIRLSL